jgi:hypothetical protein
LGGLWGGWGGGVLGGGAGVDVGVGRYQPDGRVVHPLLAFVFIGLDGAFCFGCLFWGTSCSSPSMTVLISISLRFREANNVYGISITAFSKNSHLLE